VSLGSDPDAPERARAGWSARLRAWGSWPRIARASIAGAPWLIGLAAGVAFVWSGTGTVERASLEVMGFDPDRADLIVALTLAAVAAAASCLPRGERLVPSVVGLLAEAAWFGPVFLGETQVALRPVPPNGPFDAPGWALTVLALVSTGLAAGWASAVLVGEIRAPARQIVGLAIDVAHRRVAGARQAGPPAATLLIAVLFVCSLPTLSSMLTAMPDVRMSTGGAPVIDSQSDPGIISVGGISSHASSSTGAATPTPGLQPSSSSTASSSSTHAVTPVPATPVPGSMFAPGPWLAWRPSGSGRIIDIEEPAPWIEGFRDTAQVVVYLPPGYDAGSRRYPVLYQAPWGYSVWQDSYHISAVLDDLIDSGRIPASIVVFATDWGGPYSPSECADSADRREWFDRFMVEVVAPDIDNSFRTIRQPAARVLWGFSDGAHCAATLAFRHPDVFGQAVVISGMYTTDQAYIPPSDTLAFGNDPAVIAEYTPALAASTVPRSQRSGLFFVVVGDPDDPAFGPTMTRFVNVLDLAGYPYVQLRVGVIHGWDQIRKVFPTALQESAAQMTAAGVFGNASN
jgi:esterase/lipase superfamily enzyme